MNDLSGTKELIFDTFINLTSTLGYENVSIRDITKDVGIKPASLYNHFETKEKILEYAYNYYIKHQFDNRKPIEEMMKLIETAGAEEIIRALTFTFESEDQKKYVRMILITKIIYMRLYQDSIANTIFLESHKNNSEFVVSVLQHGVNLGRIDSGFDLETFADVLIGSMIVMGVKAFSGKDYSVSQLEQENKILALIAKLLSTALK